VSSPQILSEAGPEFDAVLRRIDEDNLMAPLQVIQTLSNNSVATMGLVKRYLTESIGREREEIAANRRVIATYRADTAAKKTELKELAEKPAFFTATRCAACGYALDMPVVHFMCKHSFHQRCLNTTGAQTDGVMGGADVGGIANGETVDTVECPLCAPQNATVRAIRRAQIESRDRHDLFKEQLARSRDGFKTVAEWFGRGVLGGGVES